MWGYFSTQNVETQTKNPVINTIDRYINTIVKMTCFVNGFNKIDVSGEAMWI